MEVDITEINDDEKQSSKKQKITITYQSGTQINLLHSDCFYHFKHCNQGSKYQKKNHGNGDIFDHSFRL